MRVSLFLAQPHRRRLLAADHQIDVVLGTQAMGDRAQEAVSIRWEVYTSQCRLEVEDGTDKGRVLMRKAVMLLTSPGRGFDIVQRTNIFAPSGFVGLVYRSALAHTFTMELQHDSPS